MKYKKEQNIVWVVVNNCHIVSVFSFSILTQMSNLAIMKQTLA
jgi:hypothetical protein